MRTWTASIALRRMGHADLASGSPLRNTPTHPEPRAHHNDRSLAGAGHRCDSGGLQLDLRRVDESLSISGEPHRPADRLQQSTLRRSRWPGAATGSCAFVQVLAEALLRRSGRAGTDIAQLRGFTAPAKILFNLGMGDVFNARVAGNIENPHILGSMEFTTKVAERSWCLAWATRHVVRSRSDCQRKAWQSHAS